MTCLGLLGYFLHIVLCFSGIICDTFSLFILSFPLLFTSPVPYSDLSICQVLGFHSTALPYPAASVSPCWRWRHTTYTTSLYNRSTIT